MHETETAAAKTRQRWPLPENAQEVLRAILAHGNTSHDDEACEWLVAGTPARPGPVLPCTGWEVVSMASNGLLAGERLFMMTTRRGRHFAQHGSLDTFDDTVTDVDLAAWGRGDIDYVEQELLEALDTFHFELAITRAEALVVLLKKGVITPAEARRDV